MARKLLKRYMPDSARIKANKSLHVLGDFLHDPNLWHLNRRSASVAFFVGLFCAFIPLPTQMFIAAGIAIIVRCNLPLAVSLVWITNPLTIGPVFYGAFKLGAIILQTPKATFAFELSWAWLEDGLERIWQPLLLGCTICGLFFGTLGYFAIDALWRWNVVKRWEARKLLRHNRSKQK